MNFPIADPATLAANQAGKEEVDARSVFVGNVRMLMFLFSLSSYSLLVDFIVLVLTGLVCIHLEYELCVDEWLLILDVTSIIVLQCGYVLFLLYSLHDLLSNLVVEFTINFSVMLHLWCMAYTGYLFSDQSRLD